MAGNWNNRGGPRKKSREELARENLRRNLGTDKPVNPDRREARALSEALDRDTSFGRWASRASDSLGNDKDRIEFLKEISSKGRNHPYYRDYMADTIAKRHGTAIGGREAVADYIAEFYSNPDVLESVMNDPDNNLDGTIKEFQSRQRYKKGARGSGIIDHQGERYRADAFNRHQAGAARAFNASRPVPNIWTPFKVRSGETPTPHSVAEAERYKSLETRRQLLLSKIKQSDPYTKGFQIGEFSAQDLKNIGEWRDVSKEIGQYAPSTTNIVHTPEFTEYMKQQEKFNKSVAKYAKDNFSGKDAADFLKKHRISYGHGLPKNVPLGLFTELYDFAPNSQVENLAGNIKAKSRMTPAQYIQSLYKLNNTEGTTISNAELKKINEFLDLQGGSADAGVRKYFNETLGVFDPLTTRGGGIITEDMLGLRGGAEAAGSMDKDSRMLLALHQALVGNDTNANTSSLSRSQVKGAQQLARNFAGSLGMTTGELANLIGEGGVISDEKLLGLINQHAPQATRNYLSKQGLQLNSGLDPKLLRGKKGVLAALAGLTGAGAVILTQDADAREAAGDAAMSGLNWVEDNTSGAYDAGARKIIAAAGLDGAQATSDSWEQNVYDWLNRHTTPQEGKQVPFGVGDILQTGVQVASEMATEVPGLVMSGIEGAAEGAENIWNWAKEKATTSSGVLNNRWTNEVYKEGND